MNAKVPPLWQVSPRLSGNFQRVTTELLPTLRGLVAELISQRRASEERAQEAEAKAEAKAEVASADLLGVLINSPGVSPG